MAWGCDSGHIQERSSPVNTLVRRGQALQALIRETPSLQSQLPAAQLALQSDAGAEGRSQQPDKLPRKKHRVAS